MPDHDLAQIWEQHCRCELGVPDIEGAMATMVAEPYVNHVPVLTGGRGQDQVRRFYRDYFLGSVPADFDLAPVSRTLGTDSLVDEMVCSFTHTRQLDWMLPGILPTGRRVEVAVVAVIKFSGGRIAHEHIYWDQASVLVQIGLLDPAALPVAGAETARKVCNRSITPGASS
jgi:carboxymethylenebutenolidase